MPEPTILELTGIEVELRIWRGLDNKIRVRLEQENGDPLNLSNYDVTLTITDRPGENAVVKLTDTKTPGQHTDAAGGITIVTIPASATSGLPGDRAYTWKYTVVTRERTLNEKHIRFYGDVRILTPPTPVS